MCELRMTYERDRVVKHIEHFELSAKPIKDVMTYLEATMLVYPEIGDHEFLGRVAWFRARRTGLGGPPGDVDGLAIAPAVRTNLTRRY